jgi:NAD(P)-dependent dehydrogenase (short-subunit alcohol dehydrogenase family)
MDLTTTTALVTGANRGLGLRLATQLRERGARVYAGVRDVADVDPAWGLEPVHVDITDARSLAAAVETAGDVTLLVNNAGIALGTRVLSGDLDDARAEVETNLWGTLAAMRAFAPVIERNGGGGILNVLSALSWVAFADAGAYSVSKSAAWAMTNAARLELAPRGVRVSALHVGYMDTDMAAGIDADKADPAHVAALALDGLAAGAHEILGDDVSRAVRAGLAGGVDALYPQLDPRLG